MGRFDEIIGRLRWVVDSDREDVADYEASRRPYRDNEDVSERETSSLAQRVLKNLALIRAHEAQSDD